MKRRGQKIVSMALTIAMLFTMTGMNTVFAQEGGTTIGASGLCEHHPQHTPECGYTEGTPEVPCAHEHTDECYKEVTKCVHAHTEDCYDDSEEIATGSEAREPVNCAHICDEESGCITKELDCQHEHDEDCRYAPVIPGTPCTFRCEECAAPAPQSAGQNRATPAFTSPDYLICGENGGLLDLAVSGFGPTSYTLSGTVPEGVSIQKDMLTWSLMVTSDTPVGQHTFIITATDGGGTTINQNFTLTVNADSGGGPTVSDFSATRTGVQEVSFTFTPSTAGTYGVVLCESISDPALNTMNPASFALSGAGTVHSESKTFSSIDDPDKTYKLALQTRDTANQVNSIMYFADVPAYTQSITIVTTAEELKTQLEKTTPATINVTADIEGLGDTIAVGTDHTLNIAGGITVSTRGSYDNQLQIPVGTTLTLAGPGTLKSNNQSGSSGISVVGTLKLTAGSKLVAANSGTGSIGINLGVGGLPGTPGALVSEGGSITLENSGNNSAGITSSSGDDTVTLSDGSLTVQNTASYGLNVAHLTVTNGCAVTVENTAASSNGILTETVSFTDSTLRIANTAGTGLLAQTLTVTGGSATVANTTGRGVDIDCYANDGLFTLKNSALTLENTGGTGLAIGSSDELHIDNSTVNCAAGDGTALSLNSGSQLIGANGGKLTLAAGAKLESVGNRFSDRGSVYKLGDTVTVEAESGPASEQKLTAGTYVWDGTSLFAKIGAPATDGTFDLTQIDNLGASGGSGATAWTWDAAEGRLTLSGTGPYTLTGDAGASSLRVLLQESGAQLVLDNASFTNTGNGSAIQFSGGGTLRVTDGESTVSSGPVPGYITNGINSQTSAVTIELENDAMLRITADGVSQAIYAKDLTLRGSGTVEAVSKDFIGIFLTGGLTVGTGCALEATGDSEGIAFQGSQAISGGGSIQAVGTTRAGIAFNNGPPTLTVAFEGDLAAEGGMYGIAHSGGPGTGTVAFTKTPASLSIRGGTAAFGTILEENPIVLANTAKIPGLSEVFDSGAKEFPAPPAVTVATAGELKAELEKPTPATINVTADIALTDMDRIAVGASHTVDIADGKTFTINGSTNINVGAHTLTIGGAGKEKSTLVCNRDSGFALWGDVNSTLKLEHITANVIGGNGIGTASTEIGRGARLVLDVPDEDNLVTASDSLTVFGELDIKRFAGTAISLRSSTMTIKSGGAVRVGKGSGANQGIEVRQYASLVVEGGGSLTGGAGNGGVFLNAGSEVTGVANTFIDRGQTLSADGQVHVGADTEPASPSGLTKGAYVWNGSAFEKYDIASLEVSADGQTENFSVAKGGTLPFVATVKNGAGNEVDAALRGVEWTLIDSYAPGTTISQSGLLTVAADETAAYVQLNVRSVKNPQVFLYFIPVTIEGNVAPTVTGVTVSPTTANVQKGTTRQFSATVSGTGAYSSAVTWSVTGGGAGTSIDTNGVLTVAAGETAPTLTVTATSTADNTKKGTATVTVTSTPVTKYLVTVNGGTGGAEYEAGDTVTITATVPSGKQFKNWTVNSGGITLANASSASTTFTMPANAVTVTASFEDAPHSHVWASAWSTSTTHHWHECTASGCTITANSGKNGYGAHSGSTCSVCGYYSGGGSSGGSSSGGGSSPSTPTVTPPTPDKPNTPTDAKTEVKAPVDNTGKASATVPEKSVTDALKAAQDAAKKNGTEKNGISVTIDLKTDKAASSIAATLPASSINELVKAGVTELRIESGAGDIRLDLSTLKAIQAAGGGNVTVSMTKADVSRLSPEAQRAIGNRPVFDLSITAGGKAVVSFGGGQVSVGIPYTAAANENPGNLFGVYVDGSGKVTYLTNSSYDAKTKTLMFSTGHFSIFGIGYKQDAPVFTDTTGHWAEDDIDFVASRGLLNGTSTTTFSPNTGMTRGMFVTALYRLAGSPQVAGEGVAFTDVPADAYYTNAVKWASGKGITSGTSATTFSPDKTITRQELAVLMQNYAKAMGYTMPKTREAVTFVDAGSIGGFAKDAVKAMQMAGVMNGKDGNRFDPTGTATRAEVAATLHRYVELVIDPATAQGWDQNDSGVWMYYQDGKPVTGEKTIDGTTYHFDTKGLLTKIDAIALESKKYITHIIVYGDTLWDLARENGCTVAEIVALNGIENPNSIPVGTEIKIPKK